MIALARPTDIRPQFEAAREAQQSWRARTVSERAAFIGKLRPLIATNAKALAVAAASVNDRPIAEKLVSEVLPLADACRFLARNAARILQTRKFGSRSRPVWLGGSSFEVQRKPFGVVLVVGPGNYPLFLPLVQTLHALAAGNAVLIKPAEEATRPVHEFLHSVLRASQIPADLVQLLPEDVAAARDAVRSGVDKVIFTGSSEHGRDLLALMAESNTPGVMELSGADAVYVRADADLDRAANAIRFGLNLNGGETCMAPHAVVAHAAVARTLGEKLRAPEVKVTVVQSDDEALRLAALFPEGLGAAIFSRDERAAKLFADQLPTGFVTINDMIVPTADPRFPFGGIRASGYGVTRGAEGLLEMTYPHVVATRRNKRLPHLNAPHPGDEELFINFIAATHTRGCLSRWRAITALLKVAKERK